MRLVCCWGVLCALATVSIAQAQSYRDSLGIRVAFDFSAPSFGELASPPELPGKATLTNVVDAGKAIGSGLKDGTSVAAKSQLADLADQTTGLWNGSASPVPKPALAPNNSSPQTNSVQAAGQLDAGGSQPASPLRLPPSAQGSLSKGVGPARPVIMRLPFAKPEEMPLNGRDPVIDSMVEPTLVPRPDFMLNGGQSNSQSNQGFFSSTETPSVAVPPQAIPRQSVSPTPTSVAEPVGAGRFNFGQRGRGEGTGASLQFRKKVARPNRLMPQVNSKVVAAPQIPASRVAVPATQNNAEPNLFRTKPIAMPQAVEQMTIPQQGTVDLGKGPLVPDATNAAPNQFATPGIAPSCDSPGCDAPGCQSGGCDSPGCDSPGCDGAGCVAGGLPPARKVGAMPPCRPIARAVPTCDCSADCDASCGGHCSGRRRVSNKKKPICHRPLAQATPTPVAPSPVASMQPTPVPAACEDCGKSSCLGGCGLGKISKYLRLNPDHSCSGWFAGAYYMNLRRDDDTLGLPLASSGGASTLSTGDARMEPMNGLAARIGKMMNDNTAFEVIYWQGFPNDEQATTTASITGNPINANLAFGGLTYDNGGGAQPVDTFFQGAQSISVTRSFDYRNFEFNVLRLPLSLSGCGSKGKTNIAFVAGFRYFQAEEGLDLFADLNNEILGDDPSNELTYDIDTTNDLAGIQLGGLLNYQLTPRLYGQFGTKVGLYNNHMEQRQAVAGGNGLATVGGQGFDVTAEKDDVAFLAELDAGLAYSFSNHWRMSVGYKMLSISSYADASSQLLNSFTVSDAGQIIDNDSLILHGLFIGAEYAW